MTTEERPAVTYLLLIRHGETEWVANGRLAGRAPHIHLNEKGRAQAAALADRLAQQPLQAVYSSPLERCMETAQPLAERIGTPVRVEAGLIEVDYGAWLGRELKELGKQPEWHLVQHFPSSFRFPDGETLREVQWRVISTAEAIAAAHPNQTVALFSHGDCIRLLLAHFGGTPIDLFQRVQVSTASVSAVAIQGGRPMILNVNYTLELPVFEVKPPEEKASAR